MAEAQDRRSRSKQDPVPIAEIRQLWSRAKEETSGLSDLADAEKLVSWARMLGREIDERDLRCPQLKRVMDAIRCLEAAARKRGLKDPIPEDELAEIVFLRPLMAYATRRFPRLRLLRRFLDHCFDPAVLKTGDDLVALAKFLESVVAYAYRS